MVFIVPAGVKVEFHVFLHEMEAASFPPSAKRTAILLLPSHSRQEDTLGGAKHRGEEGIRATEIYNGTVKEYVRKRTGF